MFAGPGNLAKLQPDPPDQHFLPLPRIRFCIFHLSYPYQEELVVPTRSFANVHADFNWAYIESPAAARRALDDFLDTVPLNQVLGFGGDSKNSELTVGHARMAQESFAQVLSAKVERGFCSEEEAAGIGKLPLYDNGARVYWSNRSNA
jgi:hypothetical protein